MLVPCSSCRRHVRGGEACPFCGTPSVRPPEPSTLARMSRAMLIASAVGTAGCHTTHAAVYGGPPTPEPQPTVAPSPSESASAAPEPTTAPPAAPPVALYGAPAPPAGKP